VVIDPSHYASLVPPQRPRNRALFVRDCVQRPGCGRVPDAPLDARLSASYDGLVSEQQGYRPQQRVIPASIFTDIGWMRGTFHCSALRGFVEYLNGEHSFYKLTDVVLPGEKRSMSFFAMQRDQILLLTPGSPDENIEQFAGSSVVEHRVCCYFDVGILSGALQIGTMQRLSDFLANLRGFFIMRDCTLRSRTNEDKGSKRIPLAIVHDKRLLGIAEEEGSL